MYAPCFHYEGFNSSFPCSIDVGSGEDKTYVSLTLSELQRVGTLGMGGFGRVELVCNLKPIFIPFGLQEQYMYRLDAEPRELRDLVSRGPCRRPERSEGATTRAPEAH